VPPKIKKMGYKGVESTELVYNGYKCPPERILGGEEEGGKLAKGSDITLELNSGSNFAVVMVEYENQTKESNL